MEKLGEDRTKRFNFMKTGWLLPGVFSLLFSICMILGNSLERRGSVTFTSPLLWLGIVMMSLIATPIVKFLWDRMKKRAGLQVSYRPWRQVQNGRWQLRTFGFTAIVIFLCYLPVFLAVYPGFFVYDAQDELMQVITRNFSTHHPLLHVLLMGGMVQAGYKVTGSYNLGIAFYTLFQMLVLSCFFSWCICRLKREGMGRGGRIAAALYFGLFPVVVMFALCSAKDGLFSAMLLVMVMVLRKWQAEGKTDNKSLVMFSVAGVLMMLLRHNGFYAFAVFAVLVFRKKKLFLSAGIAVCYLLISSGLAFVLHADDSEHQEILTVPIQQMARVYSLEEDELTEEEKQTLYEILPKEALMRYTPKVSDGVKIAFNNEAYGKNPGKYLKLWLSLGLKHPFAYLNAWFMTSYGFWYPGATIDVYRGNTVFTFTYEDSSYFGYEVEQPGERHSFLPWLNELYRSFSLDVIWQRIPVLSLLFSPGFLFWLTAFILGFFCYAGKRNRAVPYLLPLLVWATVLLGPTYLVRYVVFWWFLLPVLCFELLSFDN